MMSKKKPIILPDIETQVNASVYEFGAYETPKGVENEDHGFIMYGEKNLHYDYLDKLYEESPTNNACINANVSLISGKGLQTRNADKNLDVLIILRSLMRLGEWKMVVEEYYKYGKATLKTVIKKGTNRGKKKKDKLIGFRHFPTKTLRPTPKNKDGVIEKYAYHPDWKEWDEKDKLKFLPAYGTDKYEETKDAKHQWLCIINKTSGQEYFGLPKYNGGLNWADLEVQIADYALNEVDGGFSPGYVVNFPGQGRSKEAKGELNNQVKTKLTGSRGNKVVVGFFDDEFDKVTVDAIPAQDNTAKIQANTEFAEKNIYKSHRLPPSIVGDYTSANGLNFGDKGAELETATKWVIANVIEEIQMELTNPIQMVLEDYGFMVELFVKQKDFLWKPLELEATEKDTDAKEENEDTSKDASTEEMWKEEAEEIRKHGSISIYDKIND